MQNGAAETSTEGRATQRGWVEKRRERRTHSLQLVPCARKGCGAHNQKETQNYAHNHTVLQHCCKHCDTTAYRRVAAPGKGEGAQHVPTDARVDQRSTQLHPLEQYRWEKNSAAAVLVAAQHVHYQRNEHDLRAPAGTCHRNHNPRRTSASARGEASTEA
eukprot:CAMPEP_0183352602 /NCGR_PEP_ID=MMETSP0164_2-20130417/29540_1 /TAXON_ID=221442 /ORGANISM="Coccolithus pelagicus ssp braarudi, Strain PLY182g" /LENGTH=159 /DNA_ID=CAMNT_0025525069 /DNA_START=224 /DNA_END=703 /DNA_ORIENTATION=+